MAVAQRSRSLDLIYIKLLDKSSEEEVVPVV